MNDQPDLLEEYKPSSAKSKTLNLVLVLSLLFIAALNFAIYKDVQKYYFDWTNMVLGIVIPGAGSLLLYYKKSAGWFIAAIYYSFFSSAFLYAVGDWALGPVPYPDIATIVRQLFFGLLAGAIAAPLWTNRLRKLLNVKIWLCATGILVLLMLLAGMIFDLF